MRIGIEIKHLFGNRSGIGNYLFHLLNCLSKAAPDNRFYLFSIMQKERNRFPDLSGQFHIRCSSIPSFIPDRLKRWWWHRLYLNQQTLFNQIKVFHFPSLVSSNLWGCRIVVTVHDLTFMKYPEFFTKEDYDYYMARAQETKKIAHRFIADSESTKNDLMEFMKIPEEKIEVIYLAAGENFRPIEDKKHIHQVKKKYNLRFPYILFVGNIEPRKNIVRLVKAFHELKKNTSHPEKLVIVGQKGWLFQDVFQTINDLKMDEEIIFTDYVDNEDLPALYCGAKLFAYPSLYEGFGLPVMEAMACGVPVITSRNSSLLEIGDGAAEWADPYNVCDIAEKINNLLSSEEKRNEYKMRGIVQASRFSWKKTAEKTVKVYQEVF